MPDDMLVRQLGCFLAAPPAGCSIQLSPLLDSIRQQWASNGHDIATPLENTRWWKAATTPPVMQPPPLWTFDDTMSVVTMGAFCIPEVGAAVATGADAFQRAVDHLNALVQWYVDQDQPADSTSDPLQRLADFIASRVDRDFAQQELGKIMSEIRDIEVTMHDIFEDVRRFKVNPKYNKPWSLEQLASVVEPDFLHKDFSPLWEGTEMPVPKTLLVSPEFRHYAFAAWLHGATVIVTATMAYALLRVFPDEAWTNPHWSVKDAHPDLRSLIVNDREAASAFTTLRQLLDGQSERSFYRHLDTVAEMYERIVGRLNDITVSTATASRFLNQETKTTKAVGLDLIEGVTDIGHIPRAILQERVSAQGPQCIVSDRELPHEGWLAPYRNFKETLHITYVEDAAVGAASALLNFALPVSALSYGGYVMLLNHSAATAVSEDAPDHQTVEWGPGASSGAVAKDGAAWAAFVANAYLQEWNYTVDLSNRKTLGDMVGVVKASWDTIRLLAERVS